MIQSALEWSISKGWAMPSKQHAEKAMLFSRSFAKKTPYMCSTKQWMTSRAEAGNWETNSSVRGSWFAAF